MTVGSKKKKNQPQNKTKTQNAMFPKLEYKPVRIIYYGQYIMSTQQCMS